MKKYNPILILLCLVFFESSAQENSLPQLSKEMMYEDFDYLCMVMKEANPQLEIRKIVTGHNILQSIQEYRTSIDTITNIQSFLFLIRRVLALCQDQHLSIIVPPSNYQKNIDDFIINRNIIYNEILNANFPYTLSIFKYFRGYYYYYIPAIISKINSNKKYPVQIGDKLLSVNNNNNIDDFVLEKHMNNISWDTQLNKFYASYMAIPITCDNILFQHKNKKIQINHAVHGIGKGNYSSTVNTPHVIYLEKNKILFIRIPEMNNDDLEFYKKQIIEKAKGKVIEKVILDIRGNEGGNDNLWREILRMIIDKALRTRIHFIVNKSDFLKDYFYNILDINIDNKPIITLPILANAQFIELYNETDTIIPSENSICYSDKIYILQDENTFSAASSLMRVANELPDRFVTIGEHTGKFCGRGINPILFVLPHSKIVFRMSVVLDYVNVNTVYDFYHDKIMYPIEMSPQQWYDCNITEKKRYSDQFLYKKDPMFQKAMEIK
jgi:hypothetical protein